MRTSRATRSRPLSAIDARYRRAWSFSYSLPLLQGERTLALVPGRYQLGIGSYNDVFFTAHADGTTVVDPAGMAKGKAAAIPGGIELLTQPIRIEATRTGLWTIRRTATPTVRVTHATWMTTTTARWTATTTAPALARGRFDAGDHVRRQLRRAQVRHLAVLHHRRFEAGVVPDRPFLPIAEHQREHPLIVVVRLLASPVRPRDEALGKRQRQAHLEDELRLPIQLLDPAIVDHEQAQPRVPGSSPSISVVRSSPRSTSPREPGTSMPSAPREERRSERHRDAATSAARPSRKSASKKRQMASSDTP